MKVWQIVFLLISGCFSGLSPYLFWDSESHETDTLAVTQRSDYRKMSPRKEIWGPHLIVVPTSVTLLNSGSGKCVMLGGFHTLFSNIHGSPSDFKSLIAKV